jgi:hypothetical protein
MAQEAADAVGPAMGADGLTIGRLCCSGSGGELVGAVVWVMTRRASVDCMGDNSPGVGPILRRNGVATSLVGEHT